MQLIERHQDVVTGSPDLEDLHTLASFPVFMGTVDHPQAQDLTAEQSWSISRPSGLVQLKKLLPLDVLYQSQTTTSAVGALWMTHHKAFAEFLHRYAPRQVLELGGAHGILAREYAEAHGDIPWTILEPNPSPVEGCRAVFIKGFFDDSFTAPGEFDTLVHSHVFEHMYEPERFMRQLSGFLPMGKRMVFSVPNLWAWLGKKYTNCINFEHTVFLTEPYIEFLLARHGFKLLAKEYVMGDHSIFYAAERAPDVPAVDLPAGLYQANKQLFLDYVRYHEDLIVALNRQIASAPGPVFLFGAHVFAQYLIAFGLDTGRITCILDNDARKQGKRLYGTHLMVESPRILKDVGQPTVILKAGIYNDEIRRDIQQNIHAGCIFLE